MPVKVRCPSCQKVLNAPDKARGKSLKCPSCQGRVRVPEGKSAGGAPAKRRKQRRSSGGDDFLGGVNLDKLEDRSKSVCPKCGATTYESDEVCGECGVDLETGKVRAKRRGPDPSLFYKEAWSDSWQFLMANKKLAFFTGCVWTLFALLYLAGVASTAACFNWEKGRVVADHKKEQESQANKELKPGQELEQLDDLTDAQVSLRATTKPPVVFLGFMTILMAMGSPGWYWHVSAKIIEQTMRKKKKLEMTKVQFDFFQTVIIGFKAYFWPYVLLLPVFILMSFAIVPLVITSALAIVAFGAVGALVIPLAIYSIPMFSFPVAQVHMTMPYTYPAFLPWEMLKTFFRNIGPALYWLVIAIGLTLPLIAIVAVAGFLYGPEIVSGIADTVRSASDGLLSMAGEQRSEAGGFLQSTFDIFCAGVAAVVVITPFTMTMAPIAIFLMRVNGLLGYYNRRTLDLVTRKKPDVPCGFWVRYLAMLIDFLLMLVALILFNVAFDLLSFAASIFGNEIPLKIRLFAGLAFIIFVPMYYFVKSEAGIFQGSLGKRSLGIKVTNLKGKPLTTKQALTRYVGKLFSSLVVGGGFIMAGLTEKKQALHDQFAKSLVVWEGSDDRE